MADSGTGTTYNTWGTAGWMSNYNSTTDSATTSDWSWFNRYSDATSNSVTLVARYDYRHRVIDPIEEKIKAERRFLRIWTKRRERCQRNLERKAAELRAKMLLKDLFGAELEQAQDGYLRVKSKLHRRREYRIPVTGGMVQVYERGKRKHQLCVHIRERVPKTDEVVMRRLMLEADEQRFLETANIHP